MHTSQPRSTTATIASLMVLFVLLLGLACETSGDFGGEVTSNDPNPVETADASGDWFTLYFTQPEDPSSDSLRGGPDRHLADAIRAARASVEIAAYQLNLWSLRDALIDAHRRGIQVRMVVESDNIDDPEVKELITAGIPVLGDRREGLMHNKFAIIDRQEVWTGSMNFTINGAYRNNNNLTRIHSAALAQNYLTEFEEMFIDDQFGPGSPNNTPFKMIEEGSTRIETFFSPDDGTAFRLVELISQAKENVFFLAYSFTSDDLANALIERHLAGVWVAGIMEQYQYESNIGTEFDKLKDAGIDVRLDGNRNNMHHKVIIIDEAMVITGSYNFSRSAEERNDENTLIIYNPEIAAAFIAEFNKLHSQAKP